MKHQLIQLLTNSKAFLFIALAMFVPSFVSAQNDAIDSKAQQIDFSKKFPRNYDESKVPPYTLPDPLVAEDGTVIDSVELWQRKRRPDVLQILESNLFGRPPGEIDGFESRLLSSERDGNTLIQQVVLTLEKDDRKVDVDLLVFLPADAEGPVPMIISMNFKGNHTVTDHPSVKMKNSRLELLGRPVGDKDLGERGSSPASTGSKP